MKTIQGWCFFACSNKLRTLEAPTPTNISTKSEPLIEKNGTPASPATAFAIKVLPVPGAPTSRTPFGILAPSFKYFSPFFKKSTISSNSCLSSSIPATSLNVTLTLLSNIILALLLPKDKACEPLDWTTLARIIKNIIIKRIGSAAPIIPIKEPDSLLGLTLIFTLFSDNVGYKVVSFGSKLTLYLKEAVTTSFPVGEVVVISSLIGVAIRLSCPTETSSISAFLTFAIKSVYDNSFVDVVGPPNNIAIRHNAKIPTINHIPIDWFLFIFNPLYPFYKIITHLFLINSTIDIFVSDYIILCNIISFLNFQNF